jgi:polyisoprenoid-binding protein YceI
MGDSKSTVICRCCKFNAPLFKCSTLFLYFCPIMASGYKTILGTLILAVLFINPFQIIAQGYKPVEKGTRIEFIIQKGKTADARKLKMASKMVSGQIKFDPQHLAQASFDLSFPFNTFSSANKQDEEELKGPDLFFTSKYPVMQLKSTSVSQDRPGGVVYILNGLLTIKGISKPVKVQFTAIHSGNGYLFRGLLQFNRKTFMLGDGGGYDDYVSAFVQINALKK